MACKNILALLICSLFSFELYSQNNSINQDSINILNDEYYAKFMVVTKYDYVKVKDHIIGIASDFIQFYGITYDYKLIEFYEKGNSSSELILSSSLVNADIEGYNRDKDYFINYRGPSLSSSFKLSATSYHLNAPFSYSLSLLLGASYQHYQVINSDGNYIVISEYSKGFVLPSIIIGLTVHSQKIPLSMGLSLGFNYGTGLFYCSLLYGLK